MTHVRTLLLSLSLILTTFGTVSGLEVGQPPPELSGVSWATSADLNPRDWRLVVWWHPADATDTGPSTLLRDLARQHGHRVSIQSLHVGNADTDADRIATIGYAAGVAGPATGKAWINAETALPFAVLIGPDHLVWWRGELVDAPRLLEIGASNELNRDELRNLNILEDLLREAVRSGNPIATENAIASVLAFDESHETAYYLQLGLARQRNDSQRYQEILTNLDPDTFHPRFLAELAGDLMSDPDLSWRYPDQALRFANAAVTQAPNHFITSLALAEVRYALGDVMGAQDALNQALTLAPDEPHLQAFAAYLEQARSLNDLSESAP